MQFFFIVVCFLIGPSYPVYAEVISGQLPGGPWIEIRNPSQEPTSALSWVTPIGWGETDGELIERLLKQKSFQSPEGMNVIVDLGRYYEIPLARIVNSELQLGISPCGENKFDCYARQIDWIQKVLKQVEDGVIYLSSVDHWSEAENKLISAMAWMNARVAIPELMFVIARVDIAGRTYLHWHEMGRLSLRAIQDQYFVDGKCESDRILEDDKLLAEIDELLELAELVPDSGTQQNLEDLQAIEDQLEQIDTLRRSLKTQRITCEKELKEKMKWYRSQVSIIEARGQWLSDSTCQWSSAHSRALPLHRLVGQEVLSELGFQCRARAKHLTEFPL